MLVKAGDWLSLPLLLEDDREFSTLERGVAEKDLFSIGSLSFCILDPPSTFELSSLIIELKSSLEIIDILPFTILFAGSTFLITGGCIKEPIEVEASDPRTGLEAILAPTSDLTEQELEIGDMGSWVGDGLIELEGVFWLKLDDCVIFPEY